MPAAEHRPCYGTIFPGPRHCDRAEKESGKVFSLRALTPAGMLPQARMVQADLSQWDDCLKCPEFTHSYQFCMARLALTTAINT